MFVYATSLIKPEDSAYMTKNQQQEELTSFTNAISLINIHLSIWNHSFTQQTHFKSLIQEYINYRNNQSYVYLSILAILFMWV